MSLNLTKITKLNDTIIDLKTQLDSAIKLSADNHTHTVENLKREHNELVEQVDATHLSIKTIIDEHTLKIKELSDKIELIIAQLS